MAVDAGNYTILLGVDESQPKATRKNAGNLGSAHDFYPETDTAKPGEGVPTVSDKRGGRAVLIGGTAPAVYPNLTDEWRRLIGKIETTGAGGYADHSAAPALPVTSANDDFAYGVRFQPADPYSSDGGGDEDYHVVWGFGKEAGSILVLAIGYRWDDDNSPENGGTLWITDPENGASGLPVTDQGGTPDFETVTGSPPALYILPDHWYTVTCRCYYDGSTGYLWKVYIRDETIGATYTFTQTSAAQTTDWPSTTGIDVAWQVGTAFDGSAGAVYTSAQAAVDSAWVYDAPLSDDDALATTIDGITIPWTQPSYETLASKVRFAITNERNPFPPTRAFATGATAADAPAGSYGTRPRVRYEGYEPNRPWNLRYASLRWDSAGRRKGRTNNLYEWDAFDKGLVRLPGRLAKGACTNLLNVEFSGNGIRRRRGFDIVLDTDPTRDAPAVGAFASFRTTANQLFRCVKIGTTLYSDDGAGNATALDTTFSSAEMPSFVHFLDRLAVLSATRRVIWDGAAIQEFDGESAPSTGSQAVSGGGTLDGSFYYAYTFYDPITGDETAPYVFPSGPVTPSTQGVVLSTLDNTPTDSRFTQQRIYRTVAGDAAPNFFLIATQALATSYSDSGDDDGTIAIGQVNGTYFTLNPPENFTFGIIHAGRAFYAGGANGDRVYRSEASTLNRFHADAYTAHGGVVRALASRGSQLVVITDNTVELVDSDWVRDANGATFENIATVSTTVGGVGPAAIADADDQIIWLDQRGVYTLQGDAVKKLSKPIDNIFRWFNWGRGLTFTMSYNHIREQVWVTVASSEFQSDNSLNQIQLVYQLDTGQWTLYGLDAIFAGPYDADLDGIAFGILDATGIWKEMEVGDSDGIGDGQTVAAKHAGTITSVGSLTITDTSQSWTVDEFRGYGVVIVEDDGTLHYHTIRTNTSDTLTLDRVLDGAIAADDVFYIGGILAFIELAEATMGTANRKMSRSLHTQFDDLTRGDNL